MDIAQTTFAGEGEVHLLSSEVTKEFTSDNTNLPWRVLRAAHRAAHVSTLPARARGVLAALARTVDQHEPSGVIFASRGLLSNRSMLSTRTFYRALTDLEEAGLIRRPEQERHGPRAEFGRAYLYLTQVAIDLLGFSEQPSAPREVVQGSLPSATVADPCKQDLSPPSSQKRQPGTLPADLERLRTLGFHEFLIFKLMREARLQGKRLSDVVEVTWEHLKKARSPLPYLRSLLARPVDFSHQRAVRQQAETAESVAQEEGERTAETIRRCSGKTFINPSATCISEISDDGVTLTVHHVDEARPRISIALWQVGFAAALDAGSVQIVSQSALEAFDAQRQLARQAASPSRPSLSDSISRDKTGAPVTRHPDRLQGARKRPASISESVASMRTTLAAAPRRLAA